MKADFYSYRELPAEGGDLAPIAKEMADVMRQHGAKWFRVTFFDAEHPNEPYPHGVYLQGWRVRPKRERFEYPLSYAAPVDGSPEGQDAAGGLIGAADDSAVPKAGAR